MKRLILLSIIFGTSLVVAGLILGFYLFPGAYVTDISGTVIEGISKEPIEGINVCWERYFEPFGHGHTVTDNGCVKTNNNGRYQIPTSESKKAIYLDIYFNLDGKKRNMSLSPEYIQKDYEERGIRFT